MIFFNNNNINNNFNKTKNAVHLKSNKYQYYQNQIALSQVQFSNNLNNNLKYYNCIVFNLNKILNLRIKFVNLK